MKKYYLIGIKGVGMSALAIYLSEAGFQVEGSDVADAFVTDEILAQKQIKIYSPFRAENLNESKPDVVVVSAAYGSDNIEVKTAEDMGLKTLYYSEMIGEITKDKKLIAVAGIHGKTTTTSLLSSLLVDAGLDPSYIIGAAQVPVLGSNAHYGNSENFVIEADECRKSPQCQDGKFLDLSPEIAIITSIELDHPDVYPSIEEIYQAFHRFASRVSRSGTIIINTDYPKSKKLMQTLVDRDFVTYGLSEGVDWQAVDVEELQETRFWCLHNQKKIGPFRLGVPGKHNILNALAVIIVANKYKIDLEITKKVLANFKGVQRRFEFIDKIGDIEIIDDYAHHPTAIEKTLEAVRAKYPDKKIWAIFQPHTFSRTKSLLKEFGKSFSQADKIIITDIYASARENAGGVSSLDLVNEIKKYQDNVHYMNKIEKIEKYISNFAQGQLVILTIGAGDIYKLGHKIPEILKQKGI